ncbi:MAG TPA: hypothetical protein VGO07_06115 [Candidatus Saccharimonadales bacterium]|jgi:hypothetical protein|nr:hypothetical protein [Candidatus Saccharimonadales bacterium]
MARRETVDRFDRMSRRPFRGEAPKTDADMEFIADYDKADAAMAKEIGAPAPAKTDPARIHLFNSKNEYLAGIAGRWGDKEAERRVSSQGFNSPDTGVVWTKRGDQAHDEYGMGHEMEHDGSLVVANTKPPAYDMINGQIEPIHVKDIKVGYWDLPTTLPPGEPHGLTEMVTDMSINKKLELMGRPPIVPGYRPLDLLRSALVRKVAEAHDDLTPAAVENGLILGMRTTDRSMLEKVRAVVGDEGLDTIVNMKAHLFGKEAIAIAQRLGLDTTELETYDAGRPVRYFDWQRARPTQD